MTEVLLCFILVMSCNSQAQQVEDETALCVLNGMMESSWLNQSDRTQNTGSEEHKGTRREKQREHVA